MPAWKDPVGPERKNVYVRRRLLVLLGLLAIAAFIVLVIVKPGSTGGAATAPEVKLPDEIATAEKPAVTTNELQSCATGTLVVTALTDHDSYDPGELPQLSLRIESTASAPCQADLGTAGMKFTVTSGSDEVWRSTDCQKEADHRKVILEPNKPLETEPLVWDRTRSSTDTCDAERDPVGAGGATYHLHVAAAGVQGRGTASFLLY